MAKLGFAEAFAKYDAKLKNVNWSICAQAPDGSLVVSLWSHHFAKSADGVVTCSDTTERWSGLGKDEFRRALALALSSKQRVRVVIATAKDSHAVERGEDASKIAKTFAVRDDLVGEVVEYDGARFAIRFVKS